MMPWLTFKKVLKFLIDKTKHYNYAKELPNYSLSIQIINDYYKNGIPGISEFQKMKQLIKHYEARYNSEMDDDLLSAYIAALVWYAFSQCQIGVPPKEE